MAGLDFNLQEWKSLCRKAWENEYDFLQIDRIAKTGEDRYNIRNCLELLMQNAPLKQHVFEFMTVKFCIQWKTEKTSKIWTT